MTNVDSDEILKKLRRQLHRIETESEMRMLFTQAHKIVSSIDISFLRRKRTDVFAAFLLMKSEEYLKRIEVPKVHGFLVEAPELQNLNGIEQYLETLKSGVLMILNFLKNMLTSQRQARGSGADYARLKQYCFTIIQTAAAFLHKPEKGLTLEEAIRTYYNEKLDQLKSEIETKGTEHLVASSHEHLVASSHEHLVASSHEHPTPPGNSVTGISLALSLLFLQSQNEEALTSVVFADLSQYLTTMTRLSFGTGRWSEVIPTGDHYLTTVTLKFLKLYDDPEILTHWSARLYAALYGIVGQLRIQQLFDISVDYPLSRPAIIDIKACLECGESSLRMRFIEDFSGQIHTRLLQASAATKNIIDHFLLTVKMLSEIDSTGFLLDGVMESYKQYLRQRPDTMKCIVLIFTDTQRDEACVLEEFSEEISERSDDQDEDADAKGLVQITKILQGEPENEEQRCRAAVGDLISTLVGIYNTKECFILEYQKMLAEQLMVKSDYCCLREFRVLELLKKRFGEPALHKCEVMLHDIVESKRLNDNLQQETATALVKEARGKNLPEPNFELSASMLSHLFWPEVQEAEIHLPQEIQEAMDCYAENFTKRRRPRILKWKTGAGIVDLEVTVGAQKRNYRVSPAHASILMLFNTAVSLEEEEMAEMVGISVPLLKSKVSFWIRHGVLGEYPAHGRIFYHRIAEMDRSEMVTYDDTDDDLQEQQESEDAAFQDLQSFRPYILGYLQQKSDGSSLELIHRHLKRFIMQLSFDKNEAQLAKCLNKMIEKGEIKLENGTYMLS